MKVVLTQPSYRVHRLLYKLRLWIPSSPTITGYDKDMNVVFLQHGRRAHFGWRR